MAAACGRTACRHRDPNVFSGRHRSQWLLVLQVAQPPQDCGFRLRTAIEAGCGPACSRAHGILALLVRLCRQTGVLLVLFLWASGPIAATAATATPAATQARLCCQMMHHHCEHMGTVPGQDCCAMGLPGDLPPATPAAGAPNAPQVTASMISTGMLPSKTSVVRAERLDGSPPQPPPAAVTILRI
jgi:hypothetical protein